MRLTANKQLRYLGVTYKPDEDFDADGKWYDLLQRAGLARQALTADNAPRRGRPKGSTNKPKADAPEQADTTATDTTYVNDTDQT